MHSSRKRAHPRARRRRRPLLIASGLLGLVALAFVLLALPLIGVKGDAEEAKAELTAAKDALADGNLKEAKESVANARESINSAAETSEGLSGDVWSVVPVAGTAVDDVRNLVSALDDATSIAEIGVGLYPDIAGKKASLFRNETLDLETLVRVTGSARQVGAHLRAADGSLDEIEGSTPLIGGVIADRRDEAAAEIDPMAEAYAGLEPMLDDLPQVFGAEGRQRYLVAMLNPSELRYSGGATLAFAPMTWEGGKVELGESVDTAANPRTNLTPIKWPKVPGNTFHRKGKAIIMKNATFAPSWSVSGEELLRAWQSATGESYDGLLAIDVVTLARLFGVTGGVEVPGYGTLTEDNLAQTLVGSYDDYYPDPSAQDELNAKIIPAFKDQLFGGGDYAKKAGVLSQAAAGRHFALYFRDDDVQDGFAALGLDGDLAEPEGDYVGVFTQNTNGSKVDFWQQRNIALDVSLDEDGSAENRLDVTVNNATPPYTAPVPDPRFGYFTRWAGMFLTTFVPDGVEMGQATLNDQPWDGRVGSFRDHDFIFQDLMIEPAGQARFSADYRVPDVAEIDDDRLTYRLTMDPQGMVIPQTASVTVHLPDGYAATSLPEGWAADGSTLTITSEAFDATQEWEIVAERDA